MNKNNKEGWLKKIERSQGVRIAIALVFTLVLVWFFVPESKEQDELARLLKKGDWQELVEKSNRYLEKDQSPKNFYYKAKAHFQLFKKSKEREQEIKEAVEVLNAIRLNSELYPQNQAGEYHFAMHNMLKKIEHYVYYLKLKEDTMSIASLKPAIGELFEINFLSEAQQTRENLLKTAYELLGTAYTPGGINPKTGFDCSGFTRYIFKNEGMFLPHGAFLQCQNGIEISSEEVMPGDLIFFKEDTNVTHVGLYVGKNSNGLLMIHASNTGVEELDEESSSWKNYWGKLHYFFKRIIIE